MQVKQSFATKVSYWLKVVSLGLILGLGLQFAQAWTTPSALPPGGNVSGPVTVGDVGQSKVGNLALNTSGIYANGLLVPNGNVGIGTAAPNRKLHVLFNNPNADGTNGQLVVENTANSVNGVAAMNFRVSNPGASGGIQFSLGDWQGSPSKASFGYDHGDQEFQYWTSSGTWSPKLFIGQTGKLTSNDTIYASAFHDSANAGYRADPASTSIFNTLATLGSITSGTNVTAPQFCIGASCINSWPGSGPSDNLGNHTATQNLNMNSSNRIINLAAPTGNNDAATKGYVDGLLAGGVYAFVGFNGQDCPGNICTMRGNKGVNRVQRMGAGDYRVYFSSPMPNTNYAVTSGAGSTAPNGLVWHHTYEYNTSYAAIAVRCWPNDACDQPHISIAIFR